LAKPNYQFEKRQKEMAKKSKQEEKRRQKLADISLVDSDSQTAPLPDAMPSSTDGAPSIPSHVET